jgi:hypothetical protein
VWLSVRASISLGGDANRSPECKTLPSTTASTFNSRATSANGFGASLCGIMSSENTNKLQEKFSKDRQSSDALMAPRKITKP